jgi:hypothetical protein
MPTEQSTILRRQIAVWALLCGASASDSGNSYVLGTAYRIRLSLFMKTIQSLSDSPFEPSRSLFETTVIT